LSDQTISTARAVAVNAMEAGTPRLVAGALNYHANYVNPVWAGNLIRVARIGAHIFYRPLPGGTPEGALAGALAVGEESAGDTLASRWAQPDHATVTRAYARYSKLEEPSAAKVRNNAVTPPARPVQPRDPQVFAPWGLAVR
jgi:hypothetical protein